MSIAPIGNQSNNILSLTGLKKQPSSRMAPSMEADSGSSSTQQAKQTSTDVSAMSDAELEAAAAQGNTAAQQELLRRRAAAGSKDSSSSMGTTVSGKITPQVSLDIEA
jgi:hypothetical protein